MRRSPSRLPVTITLGIGIVIAATDGSSAAQALAADQLVQSHPCGIAITSIVRPWRARLDAARPAGGDAPTRTFTVPTDWLGAWVVLRLGTDDATPAGTATLVEPERSTRRAWNHRCEVQSRPDARTVPGSGDHGQGFTDDDLRRTLRRLDAGVIFLWSPHMPLSVSGYRSISAAAERLGLRLVPLLDPMADPDYAATTVAEAGMPEAALARLVSIELTFRNLTTHAPSIQLFSDGRLLDAMLPGYRDADYYADYITAHLADPRY